MKLHHIERLLPAGIALLLLFAGIVCADGYLDCEITSDHVNELYCEDCTSCEPSAYCTLTDSNCTSEPDANQSSASGQWAQRSLEWTFAIENISQPGSVRYANLTVYEFKVSAVVDDESVFEYSPDDGDNWYPLDSFVQANYSTSNANKTYAVPLVNSWSAVNRTRFRIRGTEKSGSPDDWAWYVDAVELNVTRCHKLLYLKNESGGYWNAHAQLVTNGTYPYFVCCNSPLASLSNSSCEDATLLKLSSTTNAHVQAGNHSGAGEYPESACLSASPGGVECIYTNSDCGSDYECVCSIASSEASANNMTNAHVGPCEEYEKNVCCRVDTCNPRITIYSPENKSYSSDIIDLKVAANETIDTWWYSLNGGSNVTFEPNTTITGVSGLNNITVWANDTVGNLNSSTVWFTVGAMDMSITKIISPSFVVSGESETVGVNITVKINRTTNEIPLINVTDEVPYDFPLPLESDVRVYFIDYSPYGMIEITTNATVDITILDQSGTDPTLVMVNISKIYLTDANSNLTLNDSIMISYLMTTDAMEPDEQKIMYTHAWVEDNSSNTFDRREVSYLYAALVVVRGYKSIWAGNLSNPQNLSSKLEMKAIGGTVNELYLSDYLPEGATLWDLNVTYYNDTNDKIIQLLNNSDYIVLGPYDDTLPDGTYVDVYLYNFTIYSYLNWDGNLYDNDSLMIEYNVTVIGGGQWILPTIISGYDPQYQKHIKTETFESVNVPLFDVALKTLTARVQPGEVVKALLRMINVGGPRAKVDVFVTYSAKTMEGNLIVERSETFAIADQKEKELSLLLPEKIEGGMYTFEALVTYTGREAMSTDLFEVMGAAAGIGIGTSILYYILIAVMGIIIGALLMLRRK